LLFTSQSLFSDPKYAEIAKQARRYMCEVVRDGLDDDSYAEFSMQDYVDKKGYGAEFVQKFLLPVCKSFYFSDGTCLAEMPLRAVADFHRMQHGFQRGAMPAAQRQFFVGGAASWINTVANALEQMTVDRRSLFQLNAKIEVRRDASGRGWAVVDGLKTEHFDCVVFAVPADKISTICTELPERSRRLIERVRYSSCQAVLHTTYGVEKDRIGSFNVFERPYGCRDRYQYHIMFNVNCHQNEDHSNWTLVDKDGDEHQVVVHINPRPGSIKDGARLKKTDGSFLDYTFSHVVLNYDLMDVQRELPSVQGLDGLYFCGHWAKSVGLHEHCWASGMEAAEGVADFLRLTQEPFLSPTPTETSVTHWI